MILAEATSWPDAFIGAVLFISLAAIFISMIRKS